MIRPPSLESTSWRREPNSPLGSYFTAWRLGREARVLGARGARARPARRRGRDLRRRRVLGRRPARSAGRARREGRLRLGDVVEQPEDDPRRAAPPAAARAVAAAG